MSRPLARTWSRCPTTDAAASWPFAWPAPKPWRTTCATAACSVTHEGPCFVWVRRRISPIASYGTRSVHWATSCELPDEQLKACSLKSKDLSRIHAIVRIECSLDRLHHLDSLAVF